MSRRESAPLGAQIRGFGDACLARPILGPTLDESQWIEWQVAVHEICSVGLGLSPAIEVQRQAPLRNVQSMMRSAIGVFPMPDDGHSRDDWRRDLKTKLAWAMAAKLAGLVLLWLLFFRGGHS
jgi:hypothetical protein